MSNNSSSTSTSGPHPPQGVKVLFCLAFLFLVLFTALVWVLPPFYQSLVFFALVLISISSVIAVACALLEALFRGKPTRLLLDALAFVFFLFLCGLSLRTVCLFQETAAREYPRLVAPFLEAYRKTHGTYPESLDQLPSKPSVPRLMHGRCYSGGDDRYTFSFTQQAYIDITEDWIYKSETRKWRPESG